MPWPGNGFLNQSRNWAVESTWSSCLPLGKTVISWRYSASQGALSGRWTKPFSIIAVCACSPHGLVAFGLVAGDTMTAIGDQLLDQLGARGLVFDQHLGRVIQALLLTHRSLERRIFQRLAPQAREKKH